MWEADMTDSVSDDAGSPIPCPFVYANGCRCQGWVVMARGYGPKRGHFFTVRENVRKYRLWCSEKGDHAGRVSSTSSKERMEFYPNELAPGVEDQLWANDYMDQRP
jgi:hypothetical protein